MVGTRIRASWSQFTLSWLAVVVLFLGQGAVSTLLAQGPADYIVIFRAGTNAADRASAVGNAGAGQRFNFRGVAATAVRIPNANVLAALQRHPLVVSVIPDRPVSAYQGANGNGSNGKGGGQSGGGGAQEVTPAGVTRVGVPTSTSNGDGVAVAIVDTGVDLAHADLAGTFDAFNAFGAASCQDDEGHGTHVAGTVAAQQNGADVIGVAPKARLVCVKVLDSSGSGSDGTVMAGLDWVLANHALVSPRIKVVNMSLGRPGAINDNPALRTLVSNVDAAGITVVVAAGNDPDVEVSQQIPAAYAADGTVVAVASTTARIGSNQCRFLSAPIAADTASYFTTDGPDVIISAPGEDAEDVNRGCLIKSVGILSTRLGGGTTRLSGTSMASPHVAGAVARYYQPDLSYTSWDIRQFLGLDADRGGAAPLDSPTGAYSFDGVREGIVQAPPPE